MTQSATALEPSSRRNSYLSDSHFDADIVSSVSGTTLAPQNEISIVSHLKLAQGLIKKKQHSKDPQPAPFFADARVQSYPSPPNMVSSSSASPTTRILGSSSISTSLSSLPLTSRHRKPQSLTMAGYDSNPSEPITNPTNGGRAMSLSRLDRLQRVSQASSGSSPTESLHAQSRRGSSQLHMQSIAATGGFGHTGNQGASSARRRASQISTPDQDGAISSPASTPSSLGSGSPSGTVIAAPSDASGRDVGLNTGAGDMGGSIANTFGSTSPSFGTVSTNGMVKDMSPGSVSSYISSDMSSPTTPSSVEDLYVHAKIHALQAQHVSSYRHYMHQPSGSISAAQDSPWGLHQQQPQQTLRLEQSQNAQHQWPEHQFQVQQFQQAAGMPQQHYYPGGYDPTASTYFPPQPALATQQYYGTQQSGNAYNASDSFVPLPCNQNTEQMVEGEAQPRGSQQLGYVQTMHQPKASYYPFPARGMPTTASPPLIVPSQSQVPLPSPTDLKTVAPIVGAGSMSTSSQPAPRSPTSQIQQSHGRTRGTATNGHKSSGPTPSSTKGNSTISSSRSTKLKKHKKSTSSSSHSGHVDGKVASSAAINQNEVFQVSPLYAASTGVLFESMFNIKSSLLEGPSALANAEDVALVAPALGMGGEGTEGSDAVTTLPLRAIEAAGGIFQSQLKERGVIVDQVTGTAIVPSANVRHGDNSATLQPLPVATTKGSTAMMPPAGSGTTYTNTANMPLSASDYQYDTQSMLQGYGSSTQWSS